MASTSPTASAIKFQLNKASFVDNQTVDVTIWMKGFIVPGKSSSYEFSLITNGSAVLYISDGPNAANKALVSSYNSATSSNIKGIKNLDANK